MAKVLTDNKHYTDIATAIRGKNGTSDTYKPSEMASAIDAIETGGGSAGFVEAPAKDVNFYDYDGTRLYSYTLAEANALTKLPNPPDHEGLVFQEWNWTLEEVNSLTYPMDIGANYTTDDGSTRLYLTITDDLVGTNISFRFKQSVPNGVVLDFGDGGTKSASASGTSGASVNYTFTNTGDYVVSLKPIEGCTFSFTNAQMTNTNYAVKKVEFGDNVTAIGDLRDNYSLESVSISKDALVSGSTSSCSGLPKIKCIVIPRGSTNLLPSGYTFQKCTQTRVISFPSTLSGEFASNSFSYCTNLEYVAIPEGVTILNYDSFNSCHSLREIRIPSTVTKINGRSFENCFYLECFVVDAGSTLTINSGVFNYNCTKLKRYYFNSPTPPVLSASDSLRTNSGMKIYVPAGCAEAYKTATNWSSFANYIVEMEA